MGRSYWLDLFTGTTWDEFLGAGANVSGFRETREKVCKQVKPGDYLLCYCTGISRWIGLLEVTGPTYYDTEKTIWSQEIFPCRFPVKPLILLKPENAVPILNLKDKLSYFQDMKSPHAWTGYFRGSPAKMKPEDARVVIEAMENAQKNPRPFPYDEKKYRRVPKVFPTYPTEGGIVTVPEEDESEIESLPTKVSHEEIQWLLIDLGRNLSFDVSVARNDKNKEYKGMKFADYCVDEIPLHFDEATNSTIKNIDVVWLDGKSIFAAFEVEHTSSVYSGILRMSDLISMQPNIKIKLYIVAPEERREKVIKEIMRPTFARLKPPLSECCQYISYSALKEKIEQAKDLLHVLKPEFIDEIAEPCFEVE